MDERCSTAVGEKKKIRLMTKKNSAEKTNMSNSDLLFFFTSYPRDERNTDFTSSTDSETTSVFLSAAASGNPFK